MSTDNALDRNELHIFMDEKTGELHSTEVLGHRVLVKLLPRDDDRFLVGEPVDDAELSREALFITEALREQSVSRNVAEVLAVGSACGTKRSADEMNEHWKNLRSVRRATGRKWRIPRTINHDLKIGDIVAVQENSEVNQMWNTIRGVPDHVLVDEAHIIAKVQAA